MYGYYLIHYGVSAEDGSPGRGSGRYPLGSGERPYQDKASRISRIKSNWKKMPTKSKALAIATIAAPIASVAIGTLAISTIDKYSSLKTLAKMGTQAAELYAGMANLNSVNGYFSSGLKVAKNGQKYIDMMLKSTAKSKGYV